MNILAHFQPRAVIASLAAAAALCQCTSLKSASPGSLMAYSAAAAGVEAESEAAGATRSNAENSATGTAQPSGRLYRREGSLSLEVSSAATATKQAAEIVAELGGRVESSSASENESDSARLVARVPSGGLDGAMDRLGQLGRVTHREASAEDVTVESADAEAKLQAQRVLRDRLLALLRKAENVKDTLEIEKELARVQGEIDALANTFNRLRGEVQMARLTVKFSQRTIPGPGGLAWKSVRWVLRRIFVLG
jgi:hypothetical protein